MLDRLFGFGAVVGDPVSARTIREMLQTFVAGRGSVVLSSHVMALVEQCSTPSSR